jgi:hypothetical protein
MYTETAHRPNELTQMSECTSVSIMSIPRQIIGWSQEVKNSSNPPGLAQTELEKLRCLKSVFATLEPVSFLSISLYDRLILRRRWTRWQTKNISKTNWREIALADKGRRPKTMSIDCPTRRYQAELDALDLNGDHWGERLLEYEEAIRVLDEVRGLSEP